MSPNAHVNNTVTTMNGSSLSIVTEAAANVAASALVTNTPSTQQTKASTTSSTVNSNFFTIKTTGKNLIGLNSTNGTINLSVQNSNGKLSNGNGANGIGDDKNNSVNLANLGILTPDSSLPLSPNQTILNNNKNSSLNSNDSNNNDYDSFDCVGGNSNNNIEHNSSDSVTIGEDT